jgi:FkbM family methyltransferase
MIMRYFNLVKNIGNWWKYLGYKFGLSSDPLQFRTRSGITIEVPYGLLHTFKEIFMEECYMHGLRHTLPPHSVIIDIGANAGLFTLFAASRFPGAEILSFEPIPSNFTLLERNVGLNRGKCTVSPHQKAVAGQSGHVTMAFDGADPFFTSSSIVREGLSTGYDDKRLIEVPCTTLPAMFDEHQIEHCDFLKMDCEGAEYEIILTCPEDYLMRVRQFAIEVHQGSKPEYGAEYLKEYFHARGFRTYEAKAAFGMLWAWLPEND